MLTKLNYRHLTVGDFSGIKPYVTDDKVSRYLTWRPYDSDQKIAEYISGAAKKISYPDEVLAIEKNSEVVGTVHFISRQSGAIQFGFGVIPRFWGKGFGRKIVSDMLARLNSSEWKKNCNVVWADVHKDNIWAQNVLLINNFVLSVKNVPIDRYRFTRKI